MSEIASREVPLALSIAHYGVCRLRASPVPTGLPQTRPHNFTQTSQYTWHRELKDELARDGWSKKRRDDGTPGG